MIDEKNTKKETLYNIGRHLMEPYDQDRDHKELKDKLSSSSEPIEGVRPIKFIFAGVKYLLLTYIYIGRGPATKGMDLK